MLEAAPRNWGFPQSHLEPLLGHEVLHTAYHPDGGAVVVTQPEKGRGRTVTFAACFRGPGTGLSTPWALGPDALNVGAILRGYPLWLTLGVSANADTSSGATSPPALPETAASQVAQRRGPGPRYSRERSAKTQVHGRLDKGQGGRQAGEKGHVGC